MNARTLISAAFPVVPWRRSLVPYLSFCLLGILFTCNSFAQGTVLFGNLTSGVLKSPVYGPEPADTVLAKVGNPAGGIPPGTQVYSGPLLSGSLYRAQLFAVAGAGQSETALQPAFPVSTFRTGSAAGYLPVSTATLDNVPVDAPCATVQLRVWDNSSGLYPTWADAERAWSMGLIAAGKSVPFDVYAIGGGTNGSPRLTELRGFNIYYTGGNHLILAQPQSQAIAPGETARFRVFVDSLPPVSHQWRFKGEDISGATNDVLIISNAQPADAGEYSVMVQGALGGNPVWLLSSNATLTVAAVPRITSQPTNVTARIGSTAGFSVAFLSDGPVACQWKHFGTNLPAGTNATLAFDAVQRVDAGVYYLALTNAHGGTVSSNASLTVLDPYIISQPESQTVSAGAWLTLSVSAGGTPPFAYQWRLNGNNLPAATGNSLLLAGFAQTNAGTYTVAVSNDYSMITSAPAVLTLQNSGGGRILVANLISNLLRAPIYGPETAPVSDPVRSGNTSNGIPAGTQIYTGPLLAGGAWRAQLFAANGADRDEQSLGPSTPVITSFRTGTAAGFLPSTEVLLDAVPPDAPAATVQLRVWDNSTGNYPDWNTALAAWQSGIIDVGKSPLINVLNIGGGSNAVPYIEGLRSFNLFHFVLSSSGWFSPTAGFGFSFQSTTGATCEIEVSTNLINWSSVGYVTNADGAGQFVDPQATNLHARFYRVIVR